MDLSNKKLFIWDFDGCFVDSELAHYVAYLFAFQNQNIPLKMSLNDYYPSFTHLGDGTGSYLKKLGIPFDPKIIIESKKEIYLNIIKQIVIPVFPKIPDILDKMRKLSGRIGIASNSHILDIEIILSHFNIPLDFIVGRDPLLKPKPSPDIFLKALGDTDPKKALVFEDSERGLAAAAAAGIEAIWVQTPLNQNLTSQYPYCARLTHQQIDDLLMQALSKI